MGKIGKKGKITVEEINLMKTRSVGKLGKKGNLGKLTFPKKNWGGMMGKIGKKGKIAEREPERF